MALDFGNKVENGGVPPRGVMTATEFNTLVAQVNKNESDISASGVATPTPADGTVIVTLPNGDTTTIDFNHNHDGLVNGSGQVLKFYICEDESEYNNITTKDSNTLYIIPEEAS